MVLFQWSKCFTGEFISKNQIAMNCVTWYNISCTHPIQISKEDIEKSYGGSLGTRTFYSSAYSSSTNAYMLMYRQIDPRRNVSAIKREQFPEHIKVSQQFIQYWIGNLKKISIHF